MKFKQLTTIKEHIKNKTFSLKDFEQTYNKHKGYKEQFVKDFFNNHNESLINHIEDNLDCLVSDRLSFLDSYGKIENLNKSSVNMLKTNINGIVFNCNSKFISDLEDLNKNEIQEITIMFYLNNYNKINELMKEFLINFYELYFEDLFKMDEIEFNKYMILENLK